MQKLLQLDLLIDEQKAHEPNPLYALGNVTIQIDNTQSPLGRHTSSTTP
jgi:hypothetical protein